ncbi:MAG: Dna2/Cas4 domain-containing protein [Methanotrichaceae archaeon]
MIDFTDEIRKRTLRMIHEIGGIVEEEIEPSGTRNPGRCADCEYKRYCECALI